MNSALGLTSLDRAKNLSVFKNSKHGHYIREKSAVLKDIKEALPIVVLGRGAWPAEELLRNKFANAKGKASQAKKPVVKLLGSMPDASSEDEIPEGPIGKKKTRKKVTSSKHQAREISASGKRQKRQAAESQSGHRSPRKTNRAEVYSSDSSEAVESTRPPNRTKKARVSSFRQSQPEMNAPSKTSNGQKPSRASSFRRPRTVTGKHEYSKKGHVRSKTVSKPLKGISLKKRASDFRGGGDDDRGTYGDELSGRYEEDMRYADQSSQSSDEHGRSDDE